MTACVVYKLSVDGVSQVMERRERKDMSCLFRIFLKHLRGVCPEKIAKCLERVTEHCEQQNAGYRMMVMMALYYLYSHVAGKPYRNRAGRSTVIFVSV